MKKRALLGVRFVIFVLLTCICVYMVNRLMMPKYYYNENWATTNTYQDFYALDKDSVDVFFLGSSHAVSAFNPQVIYDTYGISSYNLGSEQQSLLVSYYWLREALKYQSPQVVVLETYTLYKYKDAYVYNDMNCSETAVRKAMDSMKLSPLKIEAAMAIEEMDPTQNALSYILTNIRYHTRWTDLSEKDFTETEMVKHGGIKGFSALNGKSSVTKDVFFKTEDVDLVEAEPMVRVADEYLGKIVDLCDEKGIKLIFVNIPYGEPVERYKSTREYAESKGIPYYDFNEESLYREIEYNAEKDGYGHPNYKGAEKLSLYIGKLLRENYNVSARNDTSFDKSREIYEQIIKNYELAETTDVYDYFDRISDSRYDIFVFVPTNIGDCVDAKLAKKWRKLGFSTDIQSIKEGSRYCGVKAEKKIEKVTNEDLAFSGSTRDGKVIYSFTIDTSVMMQSNQTFSMVIDGKECGNQSVGMDIVVYDHDFKMIVDKVNINTDTKEKTMTRY